MKVEASGLDIKKFMADIKNKLMNDASPLLEIIAEKVVFTSIRKNFEEEGRPNRWEDLTERTQRERSSEGYSPAHPILFREGELYHDSTTKEGVMWDMKKDKLTISCPLAKGQRLQNGDLNLPARPFFGLQKEDEATASKEVSLYIVKELQKLIAENQRTGIEEMLGIK